MHIEWMSSREVCKLLNITANSLDTMSQKHLGPPYTQYLPGGPRRYEIQKVLAWLKEREVAA